MKSAYEHVKAWRAANPDKVREQARRYVRTENGAAVRQRASAKYYASNIERLRAASAERQRRRRKVDPEGARRRHAQYSARQLARKIALAGRPAPAACEICCRSDLRIVWDHDHASGLFRGWICDHCNKILGLVKDSPATLRALAAYLELSHGPFESGSSEKATEG